MGRIQDRSVHLPYNATQNHSTNSYRRSLIVLVALLFPAAYYLNFSSLANLFQSRYGHPISYHEPDFSHLSSHCADIAPIQASSFLDRQRSLAETLYHLKASAYIAEPGPSAAYFANLTSASWHLSERPLLLIVTPYIDHIGTVQAQVSVLTPSFEATRAKLLHIPSSVDISYPEWPEHEDPYAAALSVVDNADKGAVIYVDGAARHFIVEGLQQAAPHAVVRGAPIEIRRLRERKSKEELEIMKCANEVTVLSIREARKHMYIGMHESEAGALVVKAMSAAGLRGPFALSLFGENAALPHGSGTDRVLKAEDFILIDCGGALHGYESDVTRTFLLPDSSPSERQLNLWAKVKHVQTVALNTALNGTITGNVDKTARKVMGDYAPYFTHRLGHGIGLEGHESPYLRGGSNDIILTGHTFSDEPGIYIEGELGIRLEDCFYIEEDGKPVYLTSGVGGQARSPWDL
ncbi:peptidase M24 [Cristinia sonorae]|uniref:Peptidase M24 n=1 Tax=Cristinia sonorae TaxID=1940300 RepID=A0A8K0XUB4_9AGAR|nr:peptidase M24 [Cristinia sonorae]